MTMIKKIYKYLFCGALGLSVVGCADLDSLNSDPNNPAVCSFEYVDEWSRKMGCG